MGRAGVRLAFCALGLGLLPGCGEIAPGAGVPTLLEAEAVIRAEHSAGPTLVGRARAATEQVVGEFGERPTGPPAGVDEDGRITIPARATWGAVQAALRVSAARRRAREGLDSNTAVLVDLPGVQGYVTIDGRVARYDTGLHLELKAPSGGLVATAIGNAWIAHYGCDARNRWTSDTLLLATWSEALARLDAIEQRREHVIQIRAHPELPATIVMRFVAAATVFKRAAVHVETRKRREFHDAVHHSGSWLGVHQSPNGCWDDSVALGQCDGRRVRGVPVSGDPKKVGNAGLTGLSLLAFLGAGYTNRGKHPFARTVSRGLRHLKNQQRPDGVFAARAGWDRATAHGFAALAMVDAYGMTGSPIFKGSAQRALDVLEPLWSASDDSLATSLTAAVLRSAELINKDARERGRPEPLRLDAELGDRVRSYARRFDVDDGGMDAACWLLARIFLGEDPGKEADIAAGALALAGAMETAGSRSDPVHLWLATLVCYQAGAKAWKVMKGVLDKHVVEGQRRDGHACCLKGSWNPRSDQVVPGGRVAATALSAMCLHVFYRYDRVFGTR